ncbi:winged-helix domain-containing protein [Novosphingobium sp. RD2P27]|uniref:Winged-helix domain-containing protein n=1 Tax=Novosphingobium kalidii TaxID=3230299 RepID=A0ABV2D1X1_9SPHN
MAAALPRVLIVDDEPSVRSAIRDFLAGEGYDVLEAQDGASMHRMLAEGEVGIVLLDVMLSGESGLSLAQALKERDDIGVIMISALGAEADRIAGLEMGADDYLPKPVSPRELLARIRALQRRYVANRASTRFHFEFAGWHLNPVRRILKNPLGVVTSLSPGEFEILLALVDNAQQVVGDLELASSLDGASPDHDVNVQVARIRQKLGVANSQNLICRAGDEGYVFVAPVTIVAEGTRTEAPSKISRSGWGDILIDTAACEARVGGQLLDLTFSEFTLLAMLYEARGTPVSKDALSRHVLGRPWQSFDRSIDVHVSNLRNKLSDQSAIAIETIRKVGYKLLIH